jgi:hypothetical protein
MIVDVTCWKSLEQFGQSNVSALFMFVASCDHTERGESVYCGYESGQCSNTKSVHGYPSLRDRDALGNGILSTYHNGKQCCLRGRDMNRYQAVVSRSFSFTFLHKVTHNNMASVEGHISTHQDGTSH